MKKFFLLIVLAASSLALAPISARASCGTGAGPPKEGCPNSSSSAGSNATSNAARAAPAAVSISKTPAASVPAPSQAVTVRSDVPHQAPALSTPSITSLGTDSCLGGVGVSLTGPLAGVGFGKSVKDDDCNRRAYTRSLQSLDQPDAALYFLSHPDATVLDALRASGYKAPWLGDGKARTAEKVEEAEKKMEGAGRASAVHTSMARDLAGGRAP